MSNSNQQTMQADHAPELFPLPTEGALRFAESNKYSFGWSAEGKRRPAEFELSFSTPAGGSVINRWPLTIDGWQAAWGFMRSKYPQLARTTADTCQARIDRGLELERGAEGRRDLEAEGKLNFLGDCVLLGGYGLDDGVRPGDHVDMHFSQQAIWITKAGSYVPYLRRAYGSTRALEFEGGAVSSGGGYRGGGFGVVGAAEGMAIASLLNSLTTKTSIHTTARLEAEGAELFLFTSQATPKTLVMRFAEVRGKINAASALPPAAASRSVEDDVTDRLLKLGDMFKADLLTPDEFAAAKTRLLG